MDKYEKTGRIVTERRTDLRIGNTCISGQYEKPMTCPYCGVYTEATVVNGESFILTGDQSAIIISFECTRCKRRFLAVYIKENHCYTLNTIIPIAENDEVHEGLKEVSPEFERIHQQAYRAELRGDIDLAAIGYRTALEVLVKDFAIKVLGEKEEEVARKKLAQAIEDYSGSIELLSTSDVVRMLSNDYTHYLKKYENISFETLKHYYNVTIAAFGMRYDARHPPVHR